MTSWEELSRADLDQVLAWAEAQPWAQAMAACQQDAQWHSEGDVWTHTKMVCRELPELDEWESLSRHEQTVLIFTALFHDAGKPQTSGLDPDTGRIKSPKHAIKGEHFARHACGTLIVTFRRERQSPSSFATMGGPHSCWSDRRLGTR